MSARRRHANDFTDALTSFRQINDEESSQTTSQTISEDDLLSTRSKLYENDKDTKSKKTRAGSIILAGNLTNQQCISSSDSYNTSEKDTCSNRQPLLKDISVVSEESSYRTIKADLNKRINLFDNEYLDRECSSIEEQSNLHTSVPKTTNSKNIKFCHLNKNKTVRQCDSINNRRRSMSESSLENVTSTCNKKLGKSKSYGTLNTMLKRDTNYNIKANQILPHSTKMTPKVSHHEKVETIVLSFNALSLSKPSILPNKKDNSHYIKDQKHDSTSEESLKEDLDPSELKTFLHWLADKKPLKEAHKPQTPFLRRLSTNYYNSPKAFTEGLLTIIEESVINNDTRASLQCSEISSYKFNEELKKMCKLIEDETIPEWPQSPGMLTPTCTRRKSQEPKSDPLRKFHTLSPGLYSTPTFSRRNSKDSKKIYRRMSKNIAKKSLHDSTSTFESLEAYCEKLYPNEYKATLQDKSQSPLKKNMDNILRACDNQMASLDDSLNINEQIEKARTCFSNPDEYNNTPEAQHDLFSGEKYDRINSKRLSDVFKQRKYSKDKMFELDDLENTLMYEIAKKRQRCLDTARIMMDIDSESTETQETQETYPNIVYTSKSPITNDDKFLKTLMYLKNYQNSLEKYKPLLNQFHQIKSCSPRMPCNKKNIRTTLISDENVGAHALSTLSGDKRILRTPKFSRKKIATPSSTKHFINKPVVSKPRLFVTPGKSPVNKGCKPKRTYFPDMPETNKQNKPEVNSHAQSIYRQIGNYDHVISPIALYIKGIDSPVKNLKPKTNEIPLTPKKKRFLRSPSPKFQLSPKRPRDKLIGMAVKNKNIADNNCTHSKVHYKLPSHIKKIGNRKVGNRINGCSTKDKVAIQHEGLTKSVQMDYLKPTETYYGSAEEFVYTE